MIVWSARYDARTAAPPEFVRAIEQDRMGVEAGLRDKLRQRYRLDRVS